MAIVRKDKLLAGYNGNLESVIVHDVDTQVDITNGLFVEVKGLMEGQREVKKGVLATDSSKDVLLIHNSEVMYDERLDKLSDFRIKAGKVARAYRLYDGDIITLTTDLFVGTPEVGQKFVAKANGKLEIAVDNSETGGIDEANESKVVFEVIEDSGYELDPLMGAFAVQVIRN